jgi:uncharacterized protein (TIGR00290 family)
VKTKKRALLSWSSGKDSAFALKVLRERDDLEVVGLLTTLNETHDRVAMHAVRRKLLEAQARAAGLPLRTIELQWPSSNEVYEARMRGAVERAAADGIQVIAFGDLFLEDVRAYREKQLAQTGLSPCFPLWGLPTDSLARTMIAEGVRARLTCVDPRVLSGAFAGREFDARLLAELPAEVDPCGERGEFHTFVYDGPMFSAPVAIEAGEVVERDGFVFADLLPAETSRDAG